MTGLGALLLAMGAGCGGTSGVIVPDPTDSATATDPHQVVLDALLVEDLGIDCGGESGPSRTCRTLSITCEGLDPISVELRVTEPPDETPRVGTIIAGSGGDGSSWWNSGSDDAVETLRLAGHRVVERRWLSPWMAGEAGFATAACRYGGVLKWVHETLDDGGPHCAIGNSVGASEVATFLLSRPEAFLLDGAVLQSGPPLTALDLACLPDDDTWTARCEAYFDDNGVCRVGVRECTVHQDPPTEIPGLIDLALPGTPCQDQDPDALAALQAESTWPPGASVGDLPVPVSQLIGSEDCVEAVPFGFLFAELAGIDATRVEGANHKPQASPEGVAALQQALAETCFPVAHQEGESP